MSVRQKRGRGEMHGGPMVDPTQHLPQVNEDAFIQDNDAVDSGDDDDDDEGKPKGDKKAGRRKIKIEFIQDKSRRHITFSKRKAGIMKKAYELSTLTGTQVLLLVVSETGLVYTFTTAKLQPLVTQPEGKNLIQACLNAPHGTLPSAMPVGQPLGRAANPGPPMALPTGPAPAGTSGPPVPPPANISGGIPMQAQPKDDDLPDDDDRPQSKRRRRDGASQAGSRSGATSPHNNAPPPLSIPPTSTSPPSGQGSANPSMGMTGSPTSPNQAHAQIGGGQYGGQYHPQQHQPPPQQQQRPDGSPVYGNQQMLPGGNYSYGGTSTQQPLGGLAAAAAQHQQWGGQPTPQQQHQQQQQQQQQQHVPQGASYGRR